MAGMSSGLIACRLGVPPLMPDRQRFSQVPRRGASRAQLVPRGRSLGGWDRAGEVLRRSLFDAVSARSFMSLSARESEICA